MTDSRPDRAAVIPELRAALDVAKQLTGDVHTDRATADASP